jgi:hypothetical protein
MKQRTADPREPNVLYVGRRSADGDGRLLRWWLGQLRQPQLVKGLVQGIDTCAETSPGRLILPMLKRRWHRSLQRRNICLPTVAK